MKKGRFVIQVFRLGAFALHLLKRCAQWRFPELRLRVRRTKKFAAPHGGGPVQDFYLFPCK